MADETQRLRPPSPKALLRISFSEDRDVKPEEFFAAIEAALRPTGCPMCGLAGVDIVLRRDTLLTASRFDPDPRPWFALLEGTLER